MPWMQATATATLDNALAITAVSELSKESSGTELNAA